MDDLIEWYGAQLDEEEEEARRGYLKADALPDYDGWDTNTTAGLPPIVAARVLREIEAKRHVLDWYKQRAAVDSRGEDAEDYGNVTGSTLEAVVRLFAAPYVDRPGYREEWRP